MPVAHKQKFKKKEEAEPVAESWSLFQGETELGKAINEGLNGGTYAIISTLILIYTLFSDDIRQICFPVEADLTFSILTICCMTYYMIEIVIYSLVQKDYFLGYYFWLDLVSTLTMAFDVIWVKQYLTGGGKNAANISQISRASRAARLGTRTVKLIRLIRMIKILKQMKTLSIDFNNNNHQEKLQKEMKQQQQQKKSQRISKIESRITSMRNMELIASIRQMERINSKRWTIIKNVGFGPEPKQIRVTGKNLLSLSLLPYGNPDTIINQDPGSENSNISDKSSKNVSIRQALTNKKVCEEGADNRDEIVESTNQPMMVPVFEDSCLEGKMSMGDDYNSDKRAEYIRYKKTRQELMATTKKPESNIPSQTEIMIPPESKVGARVQEDVQKNVISMIILILLSIPLLDGSTWFSTSTIYEQAQSSMIYLAEFSPSEYQTNADLFIAKSTTSFLNPLLYFSVEKGSTSDSFPDNYIAYAGSVNQILAHTRTDDITLIQGTGYTFGYDISEYNKMVSYFNIGRTFFVCILLIVTTIFFSSDLEFTAIAPLEEMMETVRKIALNPLNAIREIEEKNMCMENMEEEEDKVEITEPKKLQNTIVKISSLLAVGFGEAGTEIICQVIEDPTVINVMIPGQKIIAIFGFCDIRNFTDATEVLEADVMVFVNEIAHICHQQVYEHLGSPNKNIGDAFLLVWKFSNEDIKVTETEQEAILALIPSVKVSQMMDLSVLAFVKMVSAISRSETLQKYKENKGLHARIPNYQGVKMGFGLHVGWAIEGPIGSEYKIDASYLGPDVHMSSRLEGATKMYGTGMLITEAVYDLMTDNNKKNLRWVDRVISEGDAEPINLYTVDLNAKHLFDVMGVEHDKNLTGKAKRLFKIYQGRNRKALHENIMIHPDTTTDLWNDEEIRVMQELYTDRFYKEWTVGFNNYIKGNWEEALPQLNLASSLGPNQTDGPSESLIKFMEQHNGRAPIDWKGYRIFD